MPRSPHAAARRRTLDSLRAAKRIIGTLSSWWTVDGTVYEPHPDDSVQVGTWRPRRDDEYPENQARYWSSTVFQIDELIGELTKLRAHAVTEYHRTKPEETA